ISPRAKKLAEEKGVPFSNLKGSGPEGRIIEQDIIAFIKTNPGVSPLARRLMKEKKLSYDSGTGLGGLVTSGDLTTASRVDYEEKPLTNMRKIIAKAMHNSLQNSAQLTHHLSADARKMLSLRSEVKKKIADGYSYNITLNDMVCYAAIQALSQFPEANIHLMGDSIRYFKNVHLGLAVDTERGLMVPTVKNANHLSLIELSVKLKEVAEACKKGSIDPDLLSSEAATFTVSNLGNYGVEMFTPIVNIPQACILGVNTIVQRPAPLENGAFGFVPYIGLSLSYDHRALDGGPATKLLATIKNEIENLQIQL
ncbi:MAG: 2-oxo acid dehydrogenase subunit E2, partial [Bacteroidales bacterium]|nr:2-oxo acid dehydrogenase subunit E2 [Bacteroidales bacterium]